MRNLDCSVNMGQCYQVSLSVRSCNRRLYRPGGKIELFQKPVVLHPPPGKTSYDKTDSHFFDKAPCEYLAPGSSPVDDGSWKAFVHGRLHFSYFLRVESGSLSHLPIPELTSLAGIACVA